LRRYDGRGNISKGCHKKGLRQNDYQIVDFTKRRRAANACHPEDKKSITF
jgi:hypothetical protein